MIEPLLRRLPTRFILVGGKGGVGKTTTAGAIALAIADRAERVHLISTDPAHSLADLFEQNPKACTDRLTLEEFDARVFADALFTRIQPAFVNLIERGTYLDEADARSFLDLSWPGIDEVMAALRLVELHRSDVDRVVVDTAPTGHTLRLLESGKTLRSWIAAGRAMATKAGVVGATLMRQAVRFPAEDILDDIEAAVTLFEKEILQGGSFVVVTRSGRVIEAETRQLQQELQRRGVRVAATITDRATSSNQNVFIAPRLSRTTGCIALREWAQRFNEAITETTQTAATAARGNAASWITTQTTRLIWVAGKGGVGKSTCAGAIGSVLSESRTVCVVSTDPAGSLSEVFGQLVNREPTQVEANLSARQIDATAEFEQMRKQYYATVERVFASLGLASAVNLDRRVIEALFDFAPPGIDEIIALVEILEHAGDYNVTVIDSAPTGHFLRLLQLPEIAQQWVHALLRLLLKYKDVGSLDALGQDLLAFAKRLRKLKLDLTAPDTTAVYVVTLDQPLVNAETQRLRATLQQADVPIAAIVVNRADAGRAGVMRSTFSPNVVIYAPDAGTEVVGPRALRNFLTQWEIAGD